MNEGQITQFLHLIGQVRVRSNNSWVYTSCPLAPYLHAKMVDAHPSFGIKVAPGTESGYNCFTCNSKGGLVSLLYKLRRYNGRDYSAAFKFLKEVNAPSLSDMKARLERSSYQAKSVDMAGLQVSESILNQTPLKAVEPVYLPESELNQFEEPNGDVLGYLQGPKRNLSKETIKAWELGYHYSRRRISIPVRDVQGRLVGVTGRAYPDGKPKFLHTTGFQRDLYLFGESKVLKGQTGYLVEGHFDVIYLWQMGYNPVALMGGSLSRWQLQKCVEFFKEVVVVPDGDGPGQKIAKDAAALLNTRVPTKIVEVPEGRDPDELSAAELFDILGPPQRQNF